MATRYPRLSNGFIDYDELFKLAIGRLKLPLEYLDELTPHELVLLADSHHEGQKEHYEMVALAFQVGYVNAKSKKRVEMFPKQTEQRIGRITKEGKEENLSFLRDKFAKREG